MVLIDVAPETIAAKRAPSPSALNDRWRGIGRLDWVLPATSRTNEIMSDPLWTCRRFGRKPPCRARLILSPRFRCDCSITPRKQSIDRMDCFVPPSGIEPESTVLQTVALPFKLQRRCTTDCYGIWVIGPSLVRRTVCFPSLVSRAAGRRICRSLSDNRLMRLCSAIYQASCPDGITISGPSA